MSDRLPVPTAKSMEQQRRERFCVFYIADFRGESAAVKAGYAPDQAKHTANALLANPEVKAYIAKLGAIQMSRPVFDNQRLLAELEALGYSDISRTLDDAGRLLPASQWDERTARAVQSIDVVKRWAEGVEDETQCELVRVKLWDKNAALQTLAKTRGMLRDVVEHHIVAPEERAPKLKAFLREIRSALVPLDVLRSLLSDGLTDDNRRAVTDALASVEGDE